MPLTNLVLINTLCLQKQSKTGMDSHWYGTQGVCPVTLAF